MYYIVYPPLSVRPVFNPQNDFDWETLFQLIWPKVRQSINDLFSTNMTPPVHMPKYIPTSQHQEFWRRLDLKLKPFGWKTQGTYRTVERDLVAI